MNPKSLIPFIFSASLLVFNGNSARASEIPTRCEVLMVDKPFLYSVEKDGQQAFIFGTRHTGIKLEHMPEFVTKAVDASDSLIVETKKSFLASLSQVMMLPLFFKVFSKSDLSQKLSPEHWQKLTDIIAQNGIIPAGLVSRLTPLGAAFLMSIRSSDIAKRGGKLDEEIEARVIKRGQRKYALDSVLALFKIFKSLGDVESLVYELDNYDPTYNDRAKQVYLNGDEAEHREMTLQNGSPEFRQKMVYDRNQLWMPKILSILERSQKPFIAVGAAHLVGDQGVLQLLKNQGYTVERVTSDSDLEKIIP